MNKKIIITIVILIVLGGAIILDVKLRNSRQKLASFSSDISGLPGAKPTETIELKNGDTYDMTANYVTKEIGNRTYRMLAYNGSIPGPLLKVAQGAEITINFKNDTDIKTLLHSHGVRMDNPFDGSQSVQKEMEPGEIFSYKLKFPDAGIYWYHPHVREDYAQELGLYGNYLVAPTDENYWNRVNREVPLFIDDILIENGEIPLSKQSADRTLMGRFGNVMLVNGEPDFKMKAKKGEVVRFYITNAANTRTFKVGFSGVKMKLVGGDSGAYEKEEWKDGVLLGPSERTVVEVLFDQSGIFSLEHTTPNKTYKLGEVAVSNTAADTPTYAQSFSTLRTNQATIASIDPFRAYFDKPIDKRIALTIDANMNMGGMGASVGMSQTADVQHGGHMMSGGTGMNGAVSATDSDGIEWEDDMQMMNAMMGKDDTKWKIVDENTGKENMGIDWKFKKGDSVKIRITNKNDSAHPMQHPVHFHGQRFLILNKNGLKNNNLVWKDTVLVPAGQYVDILLDASNQGNWMAHCHIAEHLEAGMMFTFKVE